MICLTLKRARSERKEETKKLRLNFLLSLFQFLNKNILKLYRNKYELDFQPKYKQTKNVNNKERKKERKKIPDK